MEISMKNISYDANEAKVHDYFATLLHDSPLLANFRDGLAFRLNFEIFLHVDLRARSHHRGTGTLRLPFECLGFAVLKLRHDLEGRRIILSRSTREIHPEVFQLLASTPYRDPRVVREQNRVTQLFSRELNIRALQFGFPCRDETFSIEWERVYSAESDLQAGILFSDESREMIVDEKAHPTVYERPLQLRPPRTRRVGVRFANVASVWSDNTNDEPSVLLKLYSPPTFEQKPTARPDTSYRPKRVRKVSMDDPEHLRVVPFTSLAIRILFRSVDDLGVFGGMALAAHFPAISPLPSTPERRELFARPNVSSALSWIATIPDYSVAFQCEALLHNLRLTPAEIEELRPEIEAVAATRGYPHCAEVLRHFSTRLVDEGYTSPGPEASQEICERLRQLLKEANERQILLRWALRQPTNINIFQCHHCTITPTKMWLEGPYPDQSNRVLRWFPENKSSFLRVNFADEERLQYRWDRDVDGEPFLRKRVGGILKKGFVIAGRHFDFLAYSSSALNEHAVWFCAPFNTDEGLVDAASIRKRLGNFQKVIRYPAKYGARMSQAFSATDSALTITAEEILIIPDIVRNRVLFTDGVGTMSRALANDIQSALSKQSHWKRRALPSFEPSAFQVRIGGSKGMLSVDYTVEDTAVRIRPSMEKFTATHSLDIEIAGSFEAPSPMYLNRPLIMILETLGVPVFAFTKLQDRIVATIKDSILSIKESAELLRTYGLGAAFDLPSVFSSLNKLGMSRLPNNHFFDQGMEFALHDVLRSLKHKARIPVPNSYTLVGVADVHGYLREGEIFVCICDRYDAPFYLQGEVLITRSPAIHPGDVQLVWAIGAPPRGSPFIHESLPNCVVFATKGDRSLPNSLGGGDLDGDLYNVITWPALFPRRTVTPARYVIAEPVKLPGSRLCTIDDVADHVVNYLLYDHLGRIATDHLIIADQSSKMVEDPDCITLAMLASQAVDFKKTGQPVDLARIPRLKFHEKPDWVAGEVVKPNMTGIYQSNRALGVLFRGIDLDKTIRRAHHAKKQTDDLTAAFEQVSLEDSLSSDGISILVRAEVEKHISTASHDNFLRDDIRRHLDAFISELRYICANHSLSRRQFLTEEECWVGTIAANSTQPRRRKDLQARMRSQTKELVERVRVSLRDSEDLERCLIKAWEAWKISRVLNDVFGARSFSFIALGSIFEILEAIQEQDNFL